MGRTKIQMDLYIYKFIGTDRTGTYRQQYRGPSALCISARFTSLTAFFTFAYIDQQMKRYKCMLFTTNDLDESDE